MERMSMLPHVTGERENKNLTRFNITSISLYKCRETFCISVCPYVNW